MYACTCIHVTNEAVEVVCMCRYIEAGSFFLFVCLSFCFAFLCDFFLWLDRLSGVPEQ